MIQATVKYILTTATLVATSGSESGKSIVESWFIICMGFAHLTMPGQFCWRSARGSAGRCPSTFCPLSSPAPILLRWCARPAVWDFLPLCFPTVADLFQAAFQASICLSFCSLGTGHNRCFVASTSALNLGCEGEGGVEEGGGGEKKEIKAQRRISQVPTCLQAGRLATLPP